MEEASPDSSTSARPSRLVYGGAVAIVLAGLLLRLAVSPSYGYMGNESDLIEQKQAIHRAITLGIHEIYTLNAENDPAIAGGEWQGGYFINWPPVIVYLRYVPVWVYKQFYPLAFEYWNSEENYFRMVRTNINRRLAWSRGYTVVVKLPGILADCILALALFSYAARRTTPKLALVMAAAYTFNPGLIIESAHWGQPDAVWAALLVLSLGLLHHGKLEWALVAYALAGLTKPQPAAFFLLILYLSLAGGAFRRVLAGGTLAVATGLLVYFPFLVHGTFVESISSMLQSIFGGEPFIACNANNLWWLLSGGRGYEISDLTPVIASLSARNLGLIGFLSANVFAIWRLHSWRKWHEDAPTLFLAASFVIMSFFMFNTELHENHMMAVVPLLAFSLPGDSRRWLPFALLSTTFLLNLVLFDLSLVNGLYRLGIAPLPLKALSVANAALNTVGYGVVGWLFWQATRPSPQLEARKRHSA